MNITGLLKAANEGDSAALERLAPLVYDELRWLAHRQMQQEHAPRTLSTTALVHEAYLKLVQGPDLPAVNRRYFYAAAAQAMRHIMVSEARRRSAKKRGSGQDHLTLEDNQVAVDAVSTELLSLDQALLRLESANKHLAQIVEYRFFAGLTIGETAEVTQRSQRSIKRDWRLARAWLFREMRSPAIQTAST